MELLGDKAQVDLVLIRLEIVLALVQDRCTVCSKQGSEIILTSPIELLGDEAQVESCFGPFGDNVSIRSTRWNS